MPNLLSVQSIAQALEIYPRLRQGRLRETSKGRMMMTRLAGSIDEGDLVYLVALEGTGPAYELCGYPREVGELILLTLSGTLQTKDDHGRVVFHEAQSVALHHGSGTKHTPVAEPFWLGIIFQPHGARFL